jgi:MFS family permease
MSIGAAFALSLILGPLLNRWIGVPGIFWLTALLALLGVVLTLFVVPNPPKIQFHRDAEVAPEQVSKVLHDRELLRLDFGIFALHLCLTALFLAYPLALRDQGLASDHHWQVYLPVMLASLFAMVPLVILAESKRRMKPVFLGGVAGLIGASLMFNQLPIGMLGLILALWVFFTAFNLLEATLPSLVAKMAPSERKGTAMGVYSTSQFLGAFAGGLLGGWMHSQFGNPGVFLLCGAVASIWLLVAWGMASPNYLSNYLLPVGDLEADHAALLAKKLLDVQGVAQAVVIAEEGVAYLKVDLANFDEAALNAYAVQEG